VDWTFSAFDRQLASVSFAAFFCYAVARAPGGEIRPPSEDLTFPEVDGRYRAST
jgi:hypothetical protein